jgi:hypothetical protein
MNFCSQCLQEGHKNGDAVCDYKPLHYCSQCGIEGHNKRNTNCPINVNERRFQSSMEEIENCMGRIRIHALIDCCITEWERSHEAWQSLYERCKCEKEHFKYLYKESIEKHNYLKKYGSPEESLESYKLMSCGSRVYKFRQHALVRATKLRDNSKKYLDTILEYDRIVTEIVPCTRPKRTSEYLKEIQLSFRKPSGSGSETSLDCPVCYEQILVADALYTNCNHSYCVDCVKNLATSIKDKTIKPVCPCCRDTITKIYSNNVNCLHNLKTHLTNL